MEMEVLGPVLGIGFFILLAVIVVPLALRSSRKGQAAAKQYNQGPPGFMNQGGRFVGNVQGFPAWVVPHFDMNMMGVAWNAAMNQSFGGPNTFFHRYEFGVQVPGANFPSTTLYERDWWGAFSNVEYQRRAPQGNKVETGVPGVDATIDVHTMDPRFASIVASSPELQQALAHWPFLNLQISGDTISLELIHHWRNLEGRFGRDALMSWLFANQAFALMAAAARAAIHASQQGSSY